MNKMNSNDAVDRVLTGLRDIEAPEGMDHRILRAMHAHAATNSEPRRVASLLTPKFWLAATASAAIIATAIWWSASTRLRPAHNLATETSTIAKPDAAKPGTAEATPVPAPSPLASTAREPVISTKAAEPHRGEIRFSTSAAADPAPLDAAHSPAAGSARPDTLAASHPAPPLPLTEQERLLLRILHKGDPVELASLNNDFRGRQVVEDTAAFQRFFKQQPSSTHNAEEQKNTGDLKSIDVQPTNEDKQTIPEQTIPEQTIPDQQTIEAQPTAAPTANGVQPQ